MFTIQAIMINYNTKIRKYNRWNSNIFRKLSNYTYRYSFKVSSISILALLANYAEADSAPISLLFKAAVSLVVLPAEKPLLLRDEKEFTYSLGIINCLR